MGPPSFPLNDYRVYHQGLKQAEREADHSPPSNAKIKNKGSYTTTPPQTIMMCTGTTFVAECTLQISRAFRQERVNLTAPSDGKCCLQQFLPPSQGAPCPLCTEGALLSSVVAGVRTGSARSVRQCGRE